MARKLNLVCDVCGKPTPEIVGKLSFIPVIPGITRSAHSNYSHHADVGSCCKDKVMKAINFRRRTSVEEYHAARRAGKEAV